MELEIINKLFLELSHITTAKTFKDLANEVKIKMLTDIVYYLCTHDLDTVGYARATELGIKYLEEENII